MARLYLIAPFGTLAAATCSNDGNRRFPIIRPAA